MKRTADYVAVFKKTKKGQSVLSTSNLSSIPGGVPEEDQQYEGEHLLEVFSDPDWAGDKESRRSVSCACMFLDGNYFFSYSRTIRVLARICLKHILRMIHVYIVACGPKACGRATNFAILGPPFSSV